LRPPTNDEIDRERSRLMKARYADMALSASTLASEKRPMTDLPRQAAIGKKAREAAQRAIAAEFDPPRILITDSALPGDDETTDDSVFADNQIRQRAGRSTTAATEGRTWFDEARYEEQIAMPLKALSEARLELARRDTRDAFASAAEPVSD
jgi:hypothetical protein